MDEERRSEKRTATNLPAKWSSLSGVYEARIEDISFGGCFVNTRGQVQPGEVISLAIKLLSGEWLTLSGEVAYYQPAIGFGLLFTSLTDDEVSDLRELML